MKEGHDILKQSGMDFLVAHGMKEGAKKMVEAIQ
jgi:hypothetical protein